MCLPSNTLRGTFRATNLVTSLQVYMVTLLVFQSMWMGMGVDSDVHSFSEFYSGRPELYFDVTWVMNGGRDYIASFLIYSISELLSAKLIYGLWFLFLYMISSKEVNKFVWVKYQLQITGNTYVFRKCYEKGINSWES